MAKADLLERFPNLETKGWDVVRGMHAPNTQNNLEIPNGYEAIVFSRTNFGIGIWINGIEFSESLVYDPKRVELKKATFVAQDRNVHVDPVVKDLRRSGFEVHTGIRSTTERFNGMIVAVKTLSPFKDIKI